MDDIFYQVGLKFCAWSELFLCAIVYHWVWRAIILHKFVQCVMAFWLLFRGICFDEELFVAKYLSVIVAMDAVYLACMVSIAIVQCILLILNMQSSWYLRLIGTIFDRTNFCVIAFSVSAACATLILHRSLKSAGVVFECCSSDKKSRGCLMSVRFFGGSGTVSMWMSFTSFSVTSLANCCCCSLVALYINISCFPYIWTLATSIWLKFMMSSSYMIWCSSSSIDWCNLMPIIDTLRASISSFT